jgi:hypothetical protein
MAYASRADVDRWFTFRPPTTRELALVSVLRIKARALADAVLELTPPGADQSAALRQLRECLATATAAVMHARPLPAPEPAPDEPPDVAAHFGAAADRLMTPDPEPRPS